MKNRIFLLVFLWICIGCNRIEKEERVLIQGKDDAVLVIDVPAAKCKKCQKIIEEGLADENGVRQSILDLYTKNVSIVYNPNEISPEVLKTSVENLVKQIPCKP